MENIQVIANDELWGTTSNKSHHYHIVIVNVVVIDIHNVTVIIIAKVKIELYTVKFVCNDHLYHKIYYLWLFQ